MQDSICTQARQLCHQALQRQLAAQARDGLGADGVVLGAFRKLREDAAPCGSQLLVAMIPNCLSVNRFQSD